MFLSLLRLSSCEQEYGGSRSSFLIGYYTMVKLQHDATKLFLSSDGNVNYINGSHQQITYGTKKGVLAETYWTIYPIPNETSTVNQGDFIQCGSKIRLNHAASGSWLHSHQIEGPFGNGYEVSAFNEEDSGNFWEVECNDLWTAATQVHLKHVDTKMYLAGSVKNSYPEEMGFGYEVYLDDVPENNEWHVEGGILVGNDEDE